MVLGLRQTSACLGTHHPVVEHLRTGFFLSFFEPQFLNSVASRIPSEVASLELINSTVNSRKACWIDLTGWKIREKKSMTHDGNFPQSDNCFVQNDGRDSRWDVVLDLRTATSVSWWILQTVFWTCLLICLIILFLHLPLSFILKLAQISILYLKQCRIRWYCTVLYYIKRLMACITLSSHCFGFLADRKLFDWT